MRDLLIRYLLGELDQAEQLRLEERLRQSPELQRELEHMRACFTSPAASGDDVPPSGLAERISEQVTSLPDEDLSAVNAQIISHATVEPAAGSMSWSLADFAVAAGVFLAVSTLVLPALRGSRDTARRHVCAQNQKELGFVLTRYVSDNDVYPRVELNDAAGVFAARLVDEGYVDVDEMKQLLMCPASRQREAQFDGKYVLKIPSVQEIRSAIGPARQQLLRQMLYSYAYRVGYVEDNEYHCVKKCKQSSEPILADAPVYDALVLKIVNHGGLGFNVLFADGHVEFRREFAIPGDKNLYSNLHEEFAAGRGPGDVVLLRSEISPGVEFVQISAQKK